MDEFGTLDATEEHGRMGPVFVLAYDTECAECDCSIWEGDPGRYFDEEICCLDCYPEDD